MSRAVIRLAVLAAALAPACATARMYAGEARPRAEVAIVEGHSGWDPLNPLSISFEAVDGVPVEGLFTRDVEVLPGQRELLVDARWSMGGLSRSDEVTITLHAEAGGSYEVLARPTDVGPLEVWIVDAESRQSVAASRSIQEGAVAAELGFDGRPWELARAVRGGRPLQCHAVWTLAGERPDAWTEIVELHFIARDDARAHLARVATDAPRKLPGFQRVSQTEDALVYTDGRDEPWVERSVQCLRVGPGGVYAFTYALKQDELLPSVRDAWVGRFLRAELIAIGG